jgi:hypothetical protein
MQLGTRSDEQNGEEGQPYSVLMEPAADEENAALLSPQFTSIAERCGRPRR